MIEEQKCDECKYEHDSAGDEPCLSCSVLTNHFEPKEHSSNFTISVKKCNKAFKNEDYGYEEISNDEIDMVNHPQHYIAHGIEPIDYIESHNFNFNLGNVIKYVSRATVKSMNKKRYFKNRK